MATDRIDIEVTDKGADKAATSLRALAAAADKGADYVTRLQKALASVNVNSLAKLTAASSAATNAMARETTAQAKLTTARAAADVAASKAALSTQKLATETARTEAASARAASAQSNAALAAQRLAAANARTAQAAAQAVPAEHALGAAVASAKAQFDAGEISIRRYIAAIQAANAANMTAVGGMQPILKEGESLIQQQQRLGASMKGTGHHTANIAAQMNDLGVQFSMAAQSGEPLKMVFMALIQQGSQLAYIASTMEGGWKGVAATMAGMVLRFLPVIAAIGAATVAIKAMSSAANDAAGLDKYVKSLGLTRDELKKLEDQHVTMTDTLKALWTELSNNLLASMGLTTEEIASFWEDASEKILYFMKAAFVGVAGAVYSAVMTMAKIVTNIPKMFHNAGVAAKNLFLMSIEFLINKTIEGINAIGGVINKLGAAAGFGTIVGQMDKINLGVGGVKDGMVELAQINPWEDFKTGGLNAINTIDRATRRAGDNARKRLGDQAKELIADRNEKKTPKGAKPKEDHTAENRAKALAMVNMQLDNEIARMKLLKGEREIQERMDQIEQSLAQKKITLNAAEKASILDKVKAIEAYKYVQVEVDRIYEEAIGPLRTYTATQQALASLMASGKLTLEQHNQQMTLATRKYQESIDPLFALKEAMSQQEAAMRHSGEALQAHNYYEGIRQAYLAKGTVLSAQYVAGVNAEVDALMRRNAALQQEGYIKTQLDSVLNPILEQQKLLANEQNFYTELQRMRDADLINEDAYQRAKLSLQNKFDSMRLGAASDFFGALSEVTKNGTGAVGAISKAAAVAQATIQGYLAVQTALASAPPPFNYIAAAAVAIKAGAQVAGILSTNVGSFNTGGQFMVGGRSGVDKNNINMNVTKGERVTIETAKQQREAANDRGGGSPTVISKTKIVNQFDPKAFLSELDSEDGEEVVMNIISRRKTDTAQILGVNTR